MNRQAFHQLLNRYLSGNCSEEERHLIDQWYELLDDGIPLSVAESDLQEVENRLWNKIHRRTDQLGLPEKQSQPLFRGMLVRWLSAAAILCVVCGGVWWYSNSSRLSNSIIGEKLEKGLMEITNETDQEKPVILEDGSRITLRPKAAVAFPKHFTKDKREVFLDGEAFFEVSKNAAKPFFVYNNKLVAEVLGTSFNVKILNNRIEVAVKTGRVAVYENGQRMNLSPEQKKENGVIITPNQKVTYYEENRHFITSLVESPMPVSRENSKPGEQVKFKFDDTPLSEVLKTLEKNYEIQIVLENVNLENCPFTGDISRQTLFNKLEVICQAFQANYELKGTMILIKGGKGCN